MGNIGLPELLVILVICLIIFGAGKLPGVGRALGQSIREFKDAVQGIETSRSGDKQKCSEGSSKGPGVILPPRGACS